MYPRGAAIPPILPKPPSRPIPPSPTRTHRGEGFPVPGPLLAPAPRPPERGSIAGPVPRPFPGQGGGRGSGRPRWPAQPATQPDPPILAAYGAATMGPLSAATSAPPPPQQPMPRPSGSPPHNEGPSTPRPFPRPLPPPQDATAPPPLQAPPSESTSQPDADDDFPAGTAYNYGTWTASDDRTLLAARTRGMHWGELQGAHFPTKTANACRKRYERLMERRGAHDTSDTRRFERIASEYMAMRRQIWGGLAQRVGERWDVVEQDCFNAGLRTMQSNARSYTNRYRRESRLTPSQKGRGNLNQQPHPGLPPHLLHTGGVPGLGPVTSMGMISPVEEEFGNMGVPGGTQGSSSGLGLGASSFLGPAPGERRSAEIMPPPPPPGMMGMPPSSAPQAVQFGGYLNGRRSRGMGARGARRQAGGGMLGVAAAEVGSSEAPSVLMGGGAGGQSHAQGHSQREHGQGDFSWGQPHGDGGARTE